MSAILLGIGYIKAHPPPFYSFVFVSHIWLLKNCTITLSFMLFNNQILYYSAVTDHGNYWNYIFTAPWCRVGTYCVGVMLAYVMFIKRRAKLDVVCISNAQQCSMVKCWYELHNKYKFSWHYFIFEYICKIVYEQITWVGKKQKNY